MKKISKALQYGDFKSEVLTNGQCIFSREWEGEKVFVAINAADQPFGTGFDAGSSSLKVLADYHDGKIQDNAEEIVEFNGGVELPAYSAIIWQRA